MKLLKEVYKTRDGAEKRARFENAIAKSRWSRGDIAKLYHYTAIPHEGAYRVLRQG